MKAKKLLAAIIASSTILTLAGCSGGDETSSDSSEPQSPLEFSAQSAASTTESASAPESEPQPAPSLPNSTSEPDITSEQDNTPYVPPNNDEVGAVSGTVLVLDGGRGIPLFGIGYEPGRSYARTVNKYKEQLGENVSVYSMVVPTQVSFYLPEKYSNVSDKELPHIGDINAHLSGVIPIDVYSALKTHANEDIYYRTDHHWTQLGAYYGAEKFAEIANVPFDDISTYDRQERSGYIGTLYGSSNNNPEIKNNPETFFWYVPKRSVTTKYYEADGSESYGSSYFVNPDSFASTVEWNCTYMGGDARIAHINTGLNSGRRLMILKDSYADSLAPCLFGSFDDIWVVDMRYFKLSAVQFAKDKGITDLLFCSCTFSATSDNQYKLEEIM